MVQETVFIPLTIADLQGMIADAVRKAVVEAKAIPDRQEDTPLTFQETADLLKTSKVTVRAWADKGILQKYGTGRKMYFMKSEVLEALRKQGR